MATASKVASNFRKTAQGIKVGRKLFTKGVTSLSPAEIAALLESLGIQIPKGAVITADIAQIVMAGGAIVSDIDMAASIGSYACPTAIILSAVKEILFLSGLITPESEVGQEITVGVDVCLVIATSGTDVLADFKLAMDVITMGGGLPPDNSQLSYISALQGLAVSVNTRESLQSQAAAKNYKDLQAGKLSVFGYMGKLAEASPDLFYNYYPKAKMFIPPGTLTISYCATARSDSIIRGHEEYTRCITSDPIYTVLDNSHNFVETQIFNEYVTKYLGVFASLGTMGNRYGIDLFDLLVISMFYPTKVFPDYVDIRNILHNLSLTPFDFGSDILESEVITSHIKPGSPYSVNGVDVVTPQILAYNKITQEDKNILHFDRIGDIDSLLKIPRASKAILNWGDVNWPQSENAMVKADFDVKNFKNFWGALSIFNQIQGDTYFQDMTTTFQKYEWTSKVKNLDKKFRDLQFKSISRKLNSQAIDNIARYVGTNKQKLKRLTPLAQNSLAIYQ